MQSPSGLQPTSLSLSSLFGVGTCLYGVEYKTLLITDLASCLAHLVKKVIKLIQKNKKTL